MTATIKVASDKTALDSGDYDAAQLTEGMCYAIVCHRIGMDSQQAIDRAIVFPSGTTGGWQFQPREELHDGWWEGSAAVEASPTDDGHDAPYPQPCGQHPETHVHVLAAC